jgi:hypothetical protein
MCITYKHIIHNSVDMLSPNNHTPWWDSNLFESVPLADAMTTAPRLQGAHYI